MTDDKIKVVRVTRTEFELSDGRIYEHVVELDEVPTLEEFQELYDHWKSLLKPPDDGRKTANFG
jgi:hypothetical protein